MLTLAHTLRNAHIQRTLFDGRTAVRAYLRVLESYRPGPAGVSVFDIDQDLGLGILAARVE
jgi:hypothetical protein